MLRRASIELKPGNNSLKEHVSPLEAAKLTVENCEDTLEPAQRRGAVDDAVLINDRSSDHDIAEVSRSELIPLRSHGIVVRTGARVNERTHRE